jgi:hypothetical protein
MRFLVDLQHLSAHGQHHDFDFANCPWSQVRSYIPGMIRANPSSVPILAIIVFIYLHRQYKKRLRQEDKVDAEKYKSMDFGMDLNYGTKRARKNGGPGFDGRQMKGLSMDAGGHPFFLNSSEMAKASTDSLLMEDRYRPVVLASRSNSRANSRANSPTRRDRTDTDTTLGSHSTRYNEPSHLKYAQSASSPSRGGAFADEKPLPVPQAAKVKDASVRDSYFEKNAKAIRKSNNYLAAFFTTKEESWDEKPEESSEKSSHVNSTASTVADSRSSTKTPATSVSVDEPLPVQPQPQASDPPTQSVEKRVLALPPEPVRCPSFEASLHEYTPSFISETTNLTDILNTPRDSHQVFPSALSNLPPRGQSLARGHNQSVDAHHQQGHEFQAHPEMRRPRGQPLAHAQHQSVDEYNEQQDFGFGASARSPEMPRGQPTRNQPVDRYNQQEDFESQARVHSPQMPPAHAHNQSADGYNQRPEFQARIHSPELSPTRGDRSHRFHGESLDMHTQAFLAESPERPKYNLHGEVVGMHPEEPVDMHPHHAPQRSRDHPSRIPPRGESLAAAMPSVDEDEHVDRAGLAVPDRAQQRLSVLMRPLPAEDPTENPEERANRIRSFYKEYFDDSKPFTSQVPLPSQAADYYEDYGSEYQNGATVYDAESNGFVVASAPYAEPVTRRAMTPPPRAPPRFQPQQRGRPRGFSNAGPHGMPHPPMSPMPPRGQSAMSNHMRMPPRGQSAMSSRSREPPRRPKPPPQPLNSLPTPHQLKSDDAIFGAADFAPPLSFRDRQAGRRPDSPMGNQRPYSPAVRAFVPLASSFDDLAAIPSP